MAPAKFPADQFSPVEFKPKEASQEDWELVHAFRRIRAKERRPDDPITPDEQAEISMKHESPYDHNRYFVLKHEGKLISVVHASALKPASPAYEENKHLLLAGGSVLAEYRRQGIATRWLPLLVDVMNEYGNSVLSAQTEEESGHGFLRWLGAEERFSGAENRLDFRQADWQMVERWMGEGEKRAPGTGLELYENRLPDAILEEYCPVYTDIGNMAPRENLDMGDWKMTPDLWHEIYKQLDELGHQHHTYLAREPDGSISGLTEIYYNPAKANYITQDLTGVLPDYRGRGTGKWLKAGMLDFIRATYDDIHWVVTGNAGSNEPMLAINRALGFKEYRPGGMYQIAQEKLVAPISEISR